MHIFLTIIINVPDDLSTMIEVYLEKFDKIRI